MTRRVTGLLHGFFAGANLFLAITCAIFIVNTFNAGMTPLCLFDCALFVANLYMACFNLFEAKKNL